MPFPEYFESINRFYLELDRGTFNNKKTALLTPWEVTKNKKQPRTYTYCGLRHDIVFIDIGTSTI